MLRFLKTAVMTGVPFGLIMGVFCALRGPIPLGWVFGLAGLASGVVFGILMAAFAEWQRSRFTREDPCHQGERLLKQGPANHFRGWEGVGGWLYLTDRRLLFRSHRFNVQRHELSIPLDAILEARACATLGVVPNGLHVETARGAERFVVEGRAGWVKEIDQARQQPA
jgi:hypothetical protein